MHVMHSQIEILGAFVDKVTLDEAVQHTHEFIESGLPHQVVTVNVDFIRLAQENSEFMNIINGSALAIADGMPLVWASGWSGNKLPARVTGVELVDRCCEMAVREGYRVFLLGGEDGVPQAAAGIYVRRYPGLQVVGAYSPPLGPFSDEEDRKMVEMVRAARPHFLFVAFGAPKQDLWIFRYRDELGVPVSVGVGGVFNFVTGRIKRAPVWMQNHGFEWLYRVFQEPRRLWKRYFLKDLPIIAQMAVGAMLVRTVESLNPSSGLEPRSLATPQVSEAATGVVTPPSAPTRPTQPL